MPTARMAAVCLAAAWCCSAQPASKCVIAGRVVSASTGAPLKKTTVWVEVFSPTRGVNGAPTVSGPATTTDGQGRFSIDNLDPGSYLLSARRTGYLDQGYGASVPEIVGPPLKLAPGERREDLTLKLTPQSLVFGKVVDEDGDPVPDAEVNVVRVSYHSGRRHLEPAGGTESRDDGSFVVGNLAPGRYYLSAGPRGSMTMAELASLPREIPVTTYYPDTPDPAAAAPIDVTAGAEVRGLDIRLQTARMFRIHGRAAAHVSLQLVPADGRENRRRGVTTGSDGRFEFTGVLPGRYTIETNEHTAFLSHGDGDETTFHVAPTTLVGRAMVTIIDSDVEDVVLPLGEGAEITGRMVGLPDSNTRAAVALSPETSSADHQVEVGLDAAGTFQLHHVFPDSYDVAVSGLPDDFYVKSIVFAGRDITTGTLDLNSGKGGALEITLSPDGAQVAGTVRNAHGDALPGVLVQIWPAGGNTARSMKADAAGAFRFHSLPPGEYRVAAWENPDDDLPEYPPFRARFESQAVSVKVAERGRETVDVKAITREAAAAEAANLK